MEKSEEKKDKRSQSSESLKKETACGRNTRLDQHGTEVKRVGDGKVGKREFRVRIQFLNPSRCFLHQRNTAIKHGSISSSITSTGDLSS